MRLLPGLFTFVTLLSIGLCLAAIVSSEFRVDAKSTLIAIPVTLIYIGNWLIALEALGLGGLTMTWSLAIEEQFYLLWPPILILMLRRGVRRVNIAAALLTLAAVSAVWRVVLSELGASSVRVMRGSDTRADSILIGCALGMLATSGFVSIVSRHRRRAESLAHVGIAIVLLMIVGPALIPDDSSSSSLLYLHILVFALATASIVAAVLAFPDWWITRALSVRPLVYIGQLSYGLYLWHSAFA